MVLIQKGFFINLISICMLTQYLKMPCLNVSINDVTADDLNCTAFTARDVDDVDEVWTNVR